MIDPNFNLDDAGIDLLNLLKKKRGRKRKTEVIAMKIQQNTVKNMEDLQNEDDDIDIDIHRDTYVHIILAAFLTRYENFSRADIRDNDNIISQGFAMFDTVENMSDEEFKDNMKKLIKHLLGDDIFVHHTPN